MNYYNIEDLLKRNNELWEILATLLDKWHSNEQSLSNKEWYTIKKYKRS